MAAAPPTAPAPTVASLDAFDITLIVFYFVMVAFVGVAFYIKERRQAASAQRGGGAASSSDDFFLAGRSQSWLPIGLSLFVSNIGSEHMLGLAGSAAASGIAVGWFEWSAAFYILILGWLFAPIYHRSGIATLPEYIERRYSRRLRSLLSIISIFLYVFTKLSVSISSGATVLHSVFGLDKYVGAILLVLLTACYTALGGLAAVIVTDVAQSVVLILGAACMAGVGFSRVGGLDALRSNPPPSVDLADWQGFFHLYRPPDDPEYPTLGLLIGLHVGSLWYWCLDQAIVQRVLSAKSIGHARGACIFAGILKITPVFLMVMPGLVARKLFDADFAAEGGASYDEALPMMMKSLLPHGVLGLNLAATIAACMSSLDSVFTAASSLFCLDLYRGHLRPHASERELVAVGRAFCALLAVLTVCWLPILSLMSDELFSYIQKVSSYLSPAIVSIYLLGVCWPRANAPGAIAAFAVGNTLGFGRMIGEIACKVAKPPPRSFADLLFVSSNFLYVGAGICCVCLLTQVAVTLATPPPKPEQVEGLTIDWAGVLRDGCCGLRAGRASASPATRTLQVSAIHVEMTSSAAAGQPKTVEGQVPELREARSGAVARDHAVGGAPAAGGVSGFRGDSAGATSAAAERRFARALGMLSIALVVTMVVLFACWM